MEEQRQTETAKRVLNLVPWWERNAELTELEQINEVFNTISTDPCSIIDYLLDIIDIYKA